MTLEAVRALPWHEHDAVMAELLSGDDQHAPDDVPHDGSLESLGSQGFNVRRA